MLLKRHRDNIRYSENHCVRKTVWREIEAAAIAALDRWIIGAIERVDTKEKAS
jgi:hypothetical protein